MAGLTAALICCFAGLPLASKACVESYFQKDLADWGLTILRTSLQRIRTHLISVLAGGVNAP